MCHSSGIAQWQEIEIWQFESTLRFYILIIFDLWLLWLIIKMVKCCFPLYRFHQWLISHPTVLHVSIQRHILILDHTVQPDSNFIFLREIILIQQINYDNDFLKDMITFYKTIFKWILHESYELCLITCYYKSKIVYISIINLWSFRSLPLKITFSHHICFISGVAVEGRLHVPPSNGKTKNHTTKDRKRSRIKRVMSLTWRYILPLPPVPLSMGLLFSISNTVKDLSPPPLMPMPP